MSSLNINQLKQILNSNKDVVEKYKAQPFDYFVETGTHIGTTVIALHPYFKYIKTIEISEHYYNYAKNMIESYGISNIEQHLGDSTKELARIIDSIDQNIIYFLDGHFSSGDTGKGEKDCPLLEELEIISKRDKNDIIIIDDYRLFGTNITEDWSQISINAILKKFKPDQVFSYFVLNDRLCIFLTQKQV